MRQILRVLGWRLASRYRLRTALLCFAVALPVAVAVGLSSVATTAVTTDEEARSTTMGTADGRLSETRTLDVRASLSPGHRVVADHTYQNMPVRAAQGRRIDLKGRALDLTDPLTKGMFLVHDGQFVREPHTIALSREAARQLGVGVSDNVAVGPEQTRYRVSSILVYPPLANDVFFVSPLPIGLPDSARSTIDGSRSWLIEGPVDVKTLEAAGLNVTTRSSTHAKDSSALPLTTLALVLSLGLLAECLLLISAAMTMVAEGQARTAGLLAALGVGARQRWSFLTSYVAVLTMLGLACGVGSGLGLAWVLQGPLQERAGADWGRFTPAWPVATVICLLTAGAVALTVWFPRRRMRKIPLVGLLSPVPASIRPLPLGYRIVGIVLGLLAPAAWLCGLYRRDVAAYAALPGALFAAGALVVAVVAIGQGWARRRPALPGPTPVALAARHIVAFAPRATLTIAAIATVVALAAFLQVAAQVVVVQAEHNRFTPTLEGHTLVRTRRALDAAEVRNLGRDTAVLAPAVNTQGGNNVIVVTDMTRCVEARIPFPTGTRGGYDPSPCRPLTKATEDMPSAAVAGARDVELLASPSWSPATRAAYERGEVTVVAGPTGITGPVEVATWSVSGERFKVHPLGRSTTFAAPDSSRISELPLMYMSPAAARRMQVRGGDPRYIVAGVNSAGIRAALPADVQGDALLTQNTDSPYLAPARRMLTITVIGAATTAAAILMTMMALWNSDLRAARGTLLAIGARRAGLRVTGATLAGLLALAGATIGTVTGMVGGALMVASTGLTVPLTWGPLIAAGAAVGAALLIGAAGVPTTVRTTRNG